MEKGGREGGANKQIKKTGVNGMCTKEIRAKRSVHVQYAVRDPYMEQAETFTPQSPWRPKSCGQKPLLFRPGLLALTLAYLSCLTLMCNVDMT